MKLKASAIVLVGLLAWTTQTHGQLLRRGQHGFAVSYALIDFDFAGDESSFGRRYDFQGPAYGLSYTTPSLRALAVVGRRSVSRTLVDISVSGWTLLDLSQSGVASTQFGVPVGVLVGWRRVSIQNASDQYGVSSIAIGAGGYLKQEFNATSRLTLRASPFVGITGSELTDQVGFSWMAEADGQLEIDELLGDSGLFLGYTLRYQVWNVNGSRPFADVIDETLDYNGLMQVIRAGVKF